MREVSKAQPLEALSTIDTLDYKIMLKKMFFRFMHPLFKSVVTLIGTNKSGLLIATKVNASFSASLYAIPLAVLAILQGWIIDNQAYIGLVLVAVCIDWLLGSLKHLFWSHDWSWKENIKELALKIFLIVLVGILFQSIIEFTSKSPWKNMVTVFADVLRLSVLLYPVSSALKSSRVLSGGKFPPESLYKRIEQLTEKWGPNKEDSCNKCNK